MALSIIQGDPFAINLSVLDNNTSMPLNLTGYSVTFSLRINSAQGSALSGPAWTVSNNTIEFTIDSANTASYPSDGIGVLLMKITNANSSIIIRHKEPISFMTPEI